MSIEWKLKKYLAENHAIFSVTAFKSVIAENTGTIISLQNLCNYINSKPKMIRLETIQIICSALNCKLDDFCKISPEENKKKEGVKLSYKNTPHSKRGAHQFPNPQDYH